MQVARSFPFAPSVIAGTKSARAEGSKLSSPVMDPISQKYIGKPFPMRSYEGRVALVIEVDKARYTKLPFEHTPPRG